MKKIIFKTVGDFCSTSLLSQGYARFDQVPKIMDLLMWEPLLTDGSRSFTIRIPFFPSPRLTNSTEALKGKLNQ